MKAIYKKLLRRGITVLAAASVCAFGIHTAVTRSQRHSTLLRQSPNGELLRHPEKGEAVSAPALQNEA